MDLVGVVTTVFLLVVPLIFGLIGTAVYVVQKKYNKGKRGS